MPKNSSMELAVIWGNFSCSDLACSDLACSDLAHSDLSCIFCQKSYFFHSIFTTWELIWHIPKWNKFDQMECLHIVSQQHLHINQKNCPVSILKFSFKNDFLTQTSAPLKNHIKIFKNQKLNATSQTPIQCTTFDQYTSFTKYLYFLRYRDISTSTPHFFYTYKFELFWPQKPKNPNLTNSFLTHYPQPKMNQKSPKDPESILTLTMKLLYTYFWKMLPIGALIWLTLIWLIWAQIAQPTSNHLKIAPWSSQWFEKQVKHSD